MLPGQKQLVTRARIQPLPARLVASALWRKCLVVASICLRALMSLMANRKLFSGCNRSQVAGRNSQFASRHLQVAIRKSLVAAPKSGPHRVCSCGDVAAVWCSAASCRVCVGWVGKTPSPRLLAPGVRRTKFVLSSNCLPWSRLSKARDQKLQHSQTRPPRPQSPTTTPVQGRHPNHVNTPAGAHKDIKSDKMLINLSIAQLHAWA
jgi:hypothetical protein